MKINDSLKNEIRERKHPTDPFHPVQRLFPFNGGSPLPLCQPHLSCLAKSYISQSADPEKWCEVVAVSCRFLHSRRRRKTVMARDFPNGSASKPNLSCCCVARRSFFFLCGCVNWPLWLSHDGFLPTWVWNVCSKWLCGWRKDAFGCLQFTLQIAETSFFRSSSPRSRRSIRVVSLPPLSTWTSTRYTSMFLLAAVGELMRNHAGWR